MLTRQLPKLICLLILVGSIALTSVQVHALYTDAQKKDLTENSQEQGIASSKSEQIPAKKTHKVESFALFGEFNSQPVINEVPKDIPTTKLRLTLTGVSASNKDELARALIVGADKTTQSYKVGDTLPGSASLHKVYEDRVVLSRSGQLETLYFPEQRSAQLLSVADSPDPMESINTPTTINSVNPNFDYQAITKDFDPAQKKSIKSKLSALRAKLKAQQ